MSMILDAELAEEIVEHARQRGYERPMDYLRDLIRRDRPSTAAPVQFDNGRQLEDLLLEGLASGPSRPVTDADWAAKERELVRRHSS